MSAEARGNRDSFENYVERAIDLFTIVDLEGRFTYVNPAAPRFLGLPAARCVGRSAFDFVHPDDVERTKRAFAEWLKKTDPESEHHENRQVNQTTGAVLDLLWTVVPEYDEGGRLVHFSSFARDVTELRRVENELVASELRLRSLVTGMLDGLVTIDDYGTVREASDSCRDIFGWGPEELLGRNVSVLMPEPHRSRHDDYLARYRETGVTWILNTVRLFDCVHRSGAIIQCELSVTRIAIPGSDEALFCGIFRDVSERVRAERAVAESERRFHAVFDQEFQYVGMLSPDGTILEVNQAALAAAGAPREQVLGLPFWDSPWWRHSADARERLKESARRAAQGELVRFQTEVSAPGGELRLLDFSIKPVLDEERRPLLLVAEGRDITALKRAQERETSVLRALASVGESASVLAHEIKNPITAVNAALRAVAKQLGEDERTVLAELVERMQKLERLIRRTLSFAKPIDLEIAPVAAERVLGDVRSLLADEAVERGFELEVDVERGCPRILGDAGLLEDVVLNLARNALEAGARRLRLSAARREEDGRARVALGVDDDGPGIPDSVRARLFEPFVTTKATGTGIGLALCRKVVEQHGGTIRAGASELGGARFEVVLPAAG